VQNIFRFLCKRRYSIVACKDEKGLKKDDFREVYYFCALLKSLKKTENTLKLGRYGFRCFHQKSDKYNAEVVRKDKKYKQLFRHPYRYSLQIL
jgi:hypothetical protein